LGKQIVLNSENAFGCMVIAMKLENQVVSGVRKKNITAAVGRTGLLFPHIPFGLLPVACQRSKWLGVLRGLCSGSGFSPYLPPGLEQVN